MTPVHEVTIEKIFVVWPGQPIDCKNREKILELSMNVTNNGQLLFVCNLYFLQGRLGRKNFLDSVKNFKAILKVQHTALPS